MVFVEENLSTAVFMTVAGAAVIWPAPGVKRSQANTWCCDTSGIKNGQVMVICNTEAAEKGENSAKETAIFRVNPTDETKRKWKCNSQS
jgi:hypothetical protein